MNTANNIVFENLIPLSEIESFLNDVMVDLDLHCLRDNVRDLTMVNNINKNIKDFVIKHKQTPNLCMINSIV